MHKIEIVCIGTYVPRFDHFDVHWVHVTLNIKVTNKNTIVYRKIECSFDISNPYTHICNQTVCFDLYVKDVQFDGFKFDHLDHKLKNTLLEQSSSYTFKPYY